MSKLRSLLYSGLAVALTGAGIGCKSLKNKASSGYDSVAYRPKRQSAVRVEVSLDNAAVYVREGKRLLLVTATCGGTTSTPTPLGHFKAYNRLPRKRSNTYGFHVEPKGLLFA